MAALERMRKAKPGKKEALTKPPLERKIANAPIEIKYSCNFPIDYLHGCIIEKISNRVGLDELVLKRNELILSLRRYLNYIEQTKINTAIAELDEKINDLISGELLKKYLEKAEPLINEYLNMNFYVEEISFVSDVAEDCTNSFSNINDEKARRIDVIERFLSVAGEFVKLDVIRDIDTQMNFCIVCDCDMKDVPINENGEQTCPECSTVRYAQAMAGHKGIKSHQPNRGYDVVTTFKRELFEFQGKCKPNIPAIVYTRLIEYFATNPKFPTREEILAMECDEYGKKPFTSVDLLVKALYEIGFPSLYKKVNRIGRDLWGWKLHDLQDINIAIINDFEELQKHFPHVDKKGRTSNVCSQHRLLHHLRMRGVKVAITDFKLPGKDALLASEEIIRQMIIRAGKEYTPLFKDLERVGEINGIVLVNNKTGDKIYYTNDKPEAPGTTGVSGVTGVIGVPGILEELTND